MTHLAPSSVTLLGPVPVSPGFLDEILSLAPFLVAADGGAGQALGAGHVPDLVVGDFDSLSAADRASIPADRLHRIDEQESTDFEKCLITLSGRLVLALGFTGARLDHELAVYNAIARYPETPCILLGETDLVFHAPHDLRLTLPLGSRLSLFPMAPVTGRSEGLHWPIDGLALSPGGRVGTSNAVTGKVRLTFDGDGMLVILPKEALKTAIGVFRP